MAGDHIAVAAGIYLEQVSILRKVTLEGRCAQQVTINGGIKSPVVQMRGGASGAILRGVTITGTGIGLYMAGVTAKDPDQNKLINLNVAVARSSSRHGTNRYTVLGCTMTRACCQRLQTFESQAHRIRSAGLSLGRFADS